MKDIITLCKGCHDIPGIKYKRRISIFIPRTPNKTFPVYGPGNCLYCGRPLPPQRRKYCSDEHGYYYREDTNPWHYIDWHDYRNAIIRRDDSKCTQCALPKTYLKPLEVHHIIPLHNGGQEFEPTNCTTLCKQCHNIKHRSKSLEPTPNTQVKTLNEYTNQEGNQ